MRKSTDKTSDDTAIARGKTYEAQGLCPLVMRPVHCRPGLYPTYFLAQVEAVVGLGPSIRLGFNPGELLDFILGWTTLDIYKDDLEWEKRKSNHTSEDIRRPADGAPKPSR